MFLCPDQSLQSSWVGLHISFCQKTSLGESALYPRWRSPVYQRQHYSGPGIEAGQETAGFHQVEQYMVWCSKQTEVLEVHTRCGEKGCGPFLHWCPLPLNGTRPGVNRSVVTFTEAIMCSLLLCLLQKIHGCLPGDSCCLITSFPMPKKTEKPAIQGTRQRLQSGKQAGKQAAAEIL